MKKKIVASILAILLISFSFTNVFATSKSQIQSQINDKKEELQDVKDEKSGVLSEIDKLNTSIASTEKEISDLNDKITELTSSISDKTKEIEKKEEEFEEKDKLLQDRLVALYEAGDTTYLDMLLTSGSITDFISSYYLVAQLTKCDTEVLNAIENTKKEIEDDKKELETKKQEIDKTKSQIAEKNEKLKSDKNTKQAKVNSLTEEEKELEGELAAYNAEMEKIAAAERKAKAEEEARRKKAEEDAKKNQTTTGSTNNTGSTGATGGSSGTVTSSGKMTWPIPGYRNITSNFGYRMHPIYNTWKLHSGIDVGAPTGAKFVAADDGTVLIASYGYNGGYGNYVVINHGNGITTRYAHGTSILVSAGQKVTKGTPVLTVGSTGASTGPHAHFEVRVNGTAVNPLNYL